jgi:uncharacterized protein (TIGR02266 family)
MEEYAARRGSARLPIGAAIKVRYPGVEDDFDETVGDIGMAGMFVQSESPMPAGTLMNFEVRPSPQWRMLRGRGRVVWARHQATEVGKPTGMGVRFIELDERARRGIRWLIETYQAVGDRPFETWTIPHQFARPGGVAPVSVHATQQIEPISPAPETQPLPHEPVERREPAEKTARWPWLAAALVLVLGLGWIVLRGPEGSASKPEETAAFDPTVVAAPGAGSAEVPEVPASDSGLPVSEPADLAAVRPGEAVSPSEEAPAVIEDPAPPVDPESQVEGVLEQLVGEWAAAWSSQDPERYLAFYAVDFVPDGGASRDAWESQRRQRLSAPSYVRVAADDIEVLDLGSDTPRTVFTQSYESNTFSDQVTKSLTWGRSDGSWRILSERSAP